MTPHREPDELDHWMAEIERLAEEAQPRPIAPPLPHEHESAPRQNEMARQYRAQKELNAIAPTALPLLARVVREMKDALINIGEYWYGGDGSAVDAAEYNSDLAIDCLKHIAAIAAEARKEGTK